MFWPKRIRTLRDGRILTGGGLFRKHPERDIRSRWTEDFTPALFVSDDNARSWSPPIEAVPGKQWQDFAFTEEFDWVELDDGDLFLILRAGPKEGRLRTRLDKDGARWETTQVERTPLPYSGHPELLRTHEGILLHIATTGISYSRDEGGTWRDLALDDGLAELKGEPATPYYPKSIQMANGAVLIVGHVGGDNGYGCVDQSIIGICFFVA